MSSPSKDSKDGWNVRLAADVGVAKESAATKLFRTFQEKTIGARVVKQAQLQRVTLLQQALSTHWACKTLSTERRKLLQDAFTEAVFAPGEKITQAGERGDFFYVIEDGEVEIVLEGDLVLHVALPDQLGGGKSTICRSREATATEVLQHMVKVRAPASPLQFELVLIGESEEKVLPLSAPLSVYAIASDRLNLRVQIAQGDVKQSKGSMPANDWAGSASQSRLLQRIESLQVLERGACFGELGLIFSTTRFHTARARAGKLVRCLAVHREIMQMAFAGSPIFACLAVLQSSPILRPLSTWHLARVAAAMTPTPFQAGQVLLQRYAVCEDLAVVVDGSVRDNSMESKALQVYGDTTVFMPLPELSLCDIVAETQGLVCRLPKTALVNALGTEYQRLQDRVVKRDEESRARQRAWREQALGSHWLLTALRQEGKSSLVDSMFTRHAEDGSIIVLQGQRGDFVYVLEEGKAEVWDAGSETPSGCVGKQECFVRTLTPGAVFGDLAIIFNAKRSVTITAKGPALMQCIPEHIFLTVLQVEGSSLLDQALFLQQCPCVAGLGIWELSHMAQTLRRDTFKPADTVFKQGDTATRFYLLEQGEAQAVASNKVVETYRMGQPFGEAVATDSTHPYSVVAVTAVSTFSVEKEVFRTLWKPVCAAIKDRELMAARTKRLRRKEQVLAEFVQSEALYVSFLHILIDEFLTPLRSILNESHINKIFANVEMLCDFHDHIAASISEKNVGAVLVKYADSFQCYTPYVRNYDDAGELVKTLSKSHKGFQKFVAEKRDRPESVGGLDLMSYLIMPVQRIPRYRMLLEEIFRFTDADDRDTADLASALAKIKAVALGVNEAKRQCEEEEALAKAVNSIVGKVPIPLLAPHRKVITELDNMLPSNKKGKARVFRLIVFNDLMVVVKQSNSHYRGLFEFSACTLHVFHNVMDKKVQGVSMVPLLASNLGLGDKHAVFPTKGGTLGKDAKDTKLFTHAAPCAFVFTQSTPEQIQRVTKLVDAAREWSKDD